MPDDPMTKALKDTMPYGKGYDAVVYYGSDARERLVNGARKIANIIGTTLGPQGRNAVLDRKDRPPVVTKDGVTVLYEFDEFQDKVDNIVYELFRKEGEIVNKDVGDGTTSVLLITARMIQELNRLLTSGMHWKKLNEGANMFIAELRRRMQELAKPAMDEESLTAVLNTTANGEQEVIETLVDVFLEVGDEGMIFIRDSKSVNTQVYYEEGFVLPCKIDTPQILDPQTGDLKWENPYVLVLKDHIRSGLQLVPIMEDVMNRGDVKKLVIAYSEAAPGALDILHRNNAEDDQDIEVLSFRMPLYTDRQEAYIEDFAAFTGATILDNYVGKWHFNNVGLEQLGRVEELVASARMVRGVGGKGATTEIDDEGTTMIKDRLAKVSAERDRFTGNYEERTRMNERVAKLLGVVVSVCPGGDSEADMKRKRGVYEDAIRAGQAALRMGIVPGGGWSLYNVADCIPIDWIDDYEIRAGAKAAQTAVKYIFEKLCADVQKSPRLMARDIREYMEKNEDDHASVDFNTGKIGNMLDTQVVDALLLHDVLLEQAVSTATTLMSVDCIYTREPTQEWLEFKERQRMEHLKM